MKLKAKVESGAPVHSSAWARLTTTAWASSKTVRRRAADQGFPGARLQLDELVASREAAEAEAVAAAIDAAAAAAVEARVRAETREEIAILHTQVTQLQEEARRVDGGGDGGGVNGGLRAGAGPGAGAAAAAGAKQELGVTPPAVKHEPGVKRQKTG